MTNSTPATTLADAGVDASRATTNSDDAGSRVVDAGSGAPAAGTVAGHAFTFAHGIAYPRAVGSNGDTPGYELFLSNEALDCTQITVEGASTVDIDLPGTPPAAQTYTAIEGYDTSAGAGQASADFNSYDATCGTLTSDSSLSGSVTITKFDSATVEGSFNVTFETSGRVQQGSVAGTFTATVCNGTAPTLSCTPH